jgi:hypothetical protein
MLPVQIVLNDYRFSGLERYASGALSDGNHSWKGMAVGISDDAKSACLGIPPEESCLVPAKQVARPPDYQATELVRI